MACQIKIIYFFFFFKWSISEENLIGGGGGGRGLKEWVAVKKQIYIYESSDFFRVAKKQVL